MPLRYPYENDSLRIYRQFDLGPSVDLIMLDVRLVGRERPLPFTNPAVNNVNRTMMGAAQKTWFKQAISASTARWKIVAQQNLMAPYRILGFPAPGTEKVWNNFPAERTELLTHIYDNNIKDVVVLTGDVHAAFANDLPARLNVYNGITGNGSAAVEFVTPSLTSGGDINIPFSLLKANNPYAFFADASNRGYMILDIVPDTVSGNFLDPMANRRSLRDLWGIMVYGKGHFPPDQLPDRAHQERPLSSPGPGNSGHFRYRHQQDQQYGYQMDRLSQSRHGQVAY